MDDRKRQGEDAPVREPRFRKGSRDHSVPSESNVTKTPQREQATDTLPPERPSTDDSGD